MGFIAVKCPSCGADIQLDDSREFGFCNYCGAKVVQDKVVVEHRGTVKVDETEKLDNLFVLARRARDSGDDAEAASYYRQILQKQPGDWEAFFYANLVENASFTNAQAGDVATKLGRTMPAAYDMAIANCDPDEGLKRIQTMTKKIADRFAGIASTGATLLRKYEGGNILTPAGKVQSDLYNKLRPTAVNTVASCVVAFDPIEKKLEEIIRGENDIDKETCKKSLLYLRRIRYGIADMQFEPSVGIKERLIKAELIHAYAMKIQELDPSFAVPSVESKQNKSGGCYVATCVYGSYDCPQVWTLRRYRDDTLASSWYGRAFIRTYYAVSPTLVAWFGHTDWFKKLWRGKLDRMVKSLRESGVADTPYEDKTW